MYKRGFVWLPLLFIVAAAVMVSGGVWWWENTTSPVPSAQEETPTTSKSTSSTITIDPQHLDITSANNFVRGTAQNLGSVRVFLIQGSQKFDLGIQMISGSYYGSQWSADIPASIPSGTYALQVSGYSDLKGKNPTTEPPAIAAVVIEAKTADVSSPLTNAHATVDQTSAQLITDPNIVPTAKAAIALSGAVSSGITAIDIYVIPNYIIGPFDYGTFKQTRVSPEGAGGQLNIQGGKWSSDIQFFNQSPPPGLYTVLIYDISPSQCSSADVRTCTYPLIATSTISILQ